MTETTMTAIIRILLISTTIANNNYNNENDNDNSKINEQESLFWSPSPRRSYGRRKFL